MPLRGLDHIAITVADVDRTIDFYVRVLAAELQYADLWKRGQLPIAILQLGASRMSLHPASAPAQPHAQTPTAGSADFCLRWDGSLDDAADRLQREGVEIIEGPVPRPAADAKVGRSIYFRDPDGNLLELLSTD